MAGRRIDQELPGRQGRLLFAYLAVNRDRVASRDELAEALWPRGLPSAPDLALSALLSKLRRLLPDGALEGRSAIRLELGRYARVDVEAARDGIHRAEALIAARDWYASIGPTLVAHNISQRRFLPVRRVRGSTSCDESWRTSGSGLWNARRGGASASVEPRSPWRSARPGT